MNREIVNLNAYQKIIEVLVANGYTILQIISNPYQVFYYLVHEFSPSFAGGGQEIKFNYLKGINITDFLQKNCTSDTRNILAKMDEIMQNSIILRIEFSNKVEWYKYSVAI